jgi:hypothetical protein
MTASPTDDLASAARRIQELTKELSQARGELAEAREQQTATGGILRAISNSPSDLQGIFQEIAMTAARLCDAYDAGVLHRPGRHRHREHTAVRGGAGEDEGAEGTYAGAYRSA